MSSQENKNSRGMGTNEFKNEINFLLYTKSHPGLDGEYDAGWNCRDHAIVMALLLKRKGVYPKIANGKCMFIQGPFSGNAPFGVGQETYHKSGHNWIVDPKFGLIDVSPSLEVDKHRFRASFNGVFGRVWLPQGKKNKKVVVCHDPHDYEQAISKANHATALSTAVYMHLDEMEVTDKLIKSPFKFLNSSFSSEIKKRFGSDFYPAIAHHLHGYMLGQRDSLKSLGKLKAWGVVLDEYSG